MNVLHLSSSDESGLLSDDKEIRHYRLVGTA